MPTRPEGDQLGQGQKCAGVIRVRLAYCPKSGAVKTQPGSATMADKSPRQHMTKKAGKSLKEKRAEKQAKADTKKRTEIIPPSKKH